MSKKISDFFSVPLNTSYTAREMTQGLRDQLLPEKLSDIFGRVFTSIDNRALLDSSQPHLGVVIRMLPTKEPPVGSMPWIRNEEKGSTQSESEISSICYVASYDRVNLFNTLPENRGAARTKKDQILESDLILAYVEGEPFKDKPITEGSVVQIQFVNWPKEARIIAVQEKNTPFPATGPDGAQNAFGEADGSTVGDYELGNIKPVNAILKPRYGICKDALKVVDLANKIGIEPAMLAAIRAVESGGNPSARNFLPNKFNKGITDPSKKLPFTPGGPNKNYSFSTTPSETGKAAFEKAFSINKKLAIESAAWGKYQVVVAGVANKVWATYTPDTFMNEYNTNPEKLSDFLTLAWWQNSPNAKQAANSNDFAKLARIYNGPTYEREHYDGLIAGAYEQAIKCKEFANPAYSATSVAAVAQQAIDQQQSQPSSVAQVSGYKPPEER